MSDLGREGEGLAQRIGMRGHECLDLRLILLVEQRAGRVQEQSFAREERPQRVEQLPLPLAKRRNVALAALPTSAGIPPNLTLGRAGDDGQAALECATVP